MRTLINTLAAVLNTLMVAALIYALAGDSLLALDLAKLGGAL